MAKSTRKRSDRNKTPKNEEKISKPKEDTDVNETSIHDTQSNSLPYEGDDVIDDVIPPCHHGNGSPCEENTFHSRPLNRRSLSLVSFEYFKDLNI